MIGLEECLRRIAEREPETLAWAAVDPRPATAGGPLEGVPFGVKDVIDTADLPTAFGSPLYAGRRPRRDAAIVALLRGMGAVLVGKTRTAAFAGFDPAETRNPRAPGRTPGGSSSGSAAAVAAGMVPLALGTQTLGSVLRPAAYCGVCGFKPGFGRLPMQGVMPFAPSLDTLGLFTGSPAEMEFVWTRSFGRAARAPERAARLDAACGEAMRAALDAAVRQLRAQGLAVYEIHAPAGFERLPAAARIVNEYEGARSHRARWLRYGVRLGRRLAELVERGLALPKEDYLAALDTIAEMKRTAADLLREWPILLTPAAEGPAPEGLQATGDPGPNAPWTALGLPAMSIPLPAVGPPLGLQAVSGQGEEDSLTAWAAVLFPPK